MKWGSSLAVSAILARYTIRRIAGAIFFRLGLQKSAQGTPELSFKSRRG